MSELRELYQELILDHGRKPRNFRFPEDADRLAHGHNPLCGDRIILKLRMRGEVIEDVGFQGAGCAISTAAASTMTQAIMGKTMAAAFSLSEEFRAMVTGSEEIEFDLDDLGKLAVFEGVAAYPMRVKCASLAWHTLDAALRGEQKPVTTE